MLSELPQRLLISGVPGAGKSCFADWLGVRGYTVLKADEHPFQVNAILSTTSRGLAVLVKALGALRRRVIIEVGFQPEEHWTTAVRTMRAAGFDSWWFDATYHDALRAFRSRKGNEDGFEPQWSKIDSHRQQIEALYRNRIIMTLRDGTHMPPEQIATVIGARAQAE